MACAFSISHCNAKPVPIDIHKKNWQMKVWKIY
jgi:dTDP-4-amino-4,6-dideoxygalactose transaminase